MRSKKSETNNEKEDDFDKLIASVTANDFICAMSGCKKSTQLMHVNCEFCKSRFCLKHGLYFTIIKNDLIKLRKNIKEKKFITPFFFLLSF